MYHADTVETQIVDPQELAASAVAMSASSGLPTHPTSKVEVHTEARKEEDEEVPPTQPDPPTPGGTPDYKSYEEVVKPEVEIPDKPKASLLSPYQCSLQHKN